MGITHRCLTAVDSPVHSIWIYPCVLHCTLPHPQLHRLRPAANPLPPCPCPHAHLPRPSPAPCCMLPPPLHSLQLACTFTHLLRLPLASCPPPPPPPAPPAASACCLSRRRPRRAQTCPRCLTVLRAPWLAACPFRATRRCFERKHGRSGSLCLLCLLGPVRRCELTTRVITPIITHNLVIADDCWSHGPTRT